MGCEYCDEIDMTPQDQMTLPMIRHKMQCKGNNYDDGYENCGTLFPVPGMPTW